MISNVYNYLSTTYLPKSPTRNTTHKKSQLRDIYSTIVKLNKQSPLYMLKLSEESQKIALDIKSSALSLNEFLSEITSAGENYSAFQSKIASSSNDAAVDAQIISEDYSNLPEAFDLKVNQIAQNQINKGFNMNPNSRGPRSGYYSFVIDIDNRLFEFQFNISDSSSNLDVLGKLVSSINNTGMGLIASVQQDSSSNNIYITMETLDDSISSSFSIKDTASPNGSKGISEFYGLNNITQKSKEAIFQINEKVHSSPTNYIVFNGSLKLSLKKSDSESSRIQYIPDSSSVLNVMNEFINSYNNIITAASEASSSQKSTSKLLNSLNNITSQYSSNLESCGLIVKENGTFRLEESLAIQAINDGDIQELLTENTGVIKDIINATKLIALNPMDYIDKILVTYPDITKPGFPNPYITSIYSGMLYNYYC